MALYKLDYYYYYYYKNSDENNTVRVDSNKKVRRQNYIGNVSFPNEKKTYLFSLKR